MSSRDILLREPAGRPRHPFTPEPPLSHDEPSPAAPPEVIGPYRVLHQIGSGVLGPVFRVLDPDTDAIVAVKQFRLDWTPEQAHALAGALQTLIETLPAHPSIVRPLSAGLDGATVWLAQELVAADGLDARMRRRTAVGAEALVAVLRQIALALDVGAEAGWRHGALHPRDVLVDTTGRVRVTGIGIAQLVERFGAKPPRRRPFGAPERAPGQPWDTRADVFALAVIAVEWLAPRRARPGAEPLAETLERAGFDGETAVRVLEAATSANSTERPPTASALVEALAAAIDLERVARMRTPAPGSLFATIDPAAGVVPEGATLAVTEDARPVNDETVIEGPAGAGPEEAPAFARAEADGPEEPTDVGAHEGIARRHAEADLPEGPADRLVDATASSPELLAEATIGPAEDWAAEAAPEPDLALREESEVPAAPEPPRFLPDEMPRPAPLEDPASYRTVDHMDRPGDADGARPPAVSPWPQGTSDHRPAAVTSPARPSVNVWALALAATLMLGLAAGFFLGRWSMSPTRPAALATEPASAGSTAAEVRDEPVRSEPPSGPAAARSEARPAAAAPASPAPAAPARPPAAATGRILVRTTPPGARVRLDGRDRGATPLTIGGLPPGRHQLEIVRPGYEGTSRRVELTADRPSVTLDVPLRALRAAAPASAPAPAPTRGPASLEFVTRPAGAEVWVDGRRVGVTPFKLADVAPGAKAIRFELAGHARWANTITLAAGEARRVTASLEPRR